MPPQGLNEFAEIVDNLGRSWYCLRGFCCEGLWFKNKNDFMKKGLIKLIALAAVGFCVHTAQAYVIASWSTGDITTGSSDTTVYYANGGYEQPNWATLQYSGGAGGTYTITFDGTAFPYVLVVNGASDTSDTETWVGNPGGNSETSSSAGASQTIDFSGATGLGTTSDTLTFTPGSFVSFSEIEIDAVPEPVNYALAGFGLVFVCGSAGNFYLGRRRSATAS